MNIIKTMDPFHTESWCQQCTTDPYRVFALCFEHAGSIDQLRKLLLYLPLFIDQPKPAGKIPPYTICQAFMAISSVIDAAYAIYTGGSRLQVKKPGGYQSVFQTAAPPGQRNFAAYLITQGEYARLYKVLRKFFNYQPRERWKAALHALLYHSLTGNAIGIELNVFAVWFYLSKLLEMAWLVAAC
ncbi:hypothetical protein A8C56_20825 [Niabella ginsenosidivorans]|uniref:Uncharacterized protein n=1 Tax=Niabella ginsenosidivorans TaxID=1176587 RepID=A0A1A9I601_9BACT|nr:hypothetical protein [Niabella ginsenosidivorans]ANH83098.1 hypothetical protein A8C56_20825 [Niabella ginsenosidivorans]